MSACLAMLVAVVYFQTRQFEFVGFDDPQLVTENIHVRQGLTRQGLKWAVSSAWRENVFFYPLSLISHMADVTWAGFNAGRHHLTSVAVHALVTLSFFALLVQLTGAFWRPGLAAGFFAVHPLGVDSVAWVAERSNLLCALLIIATLLAFRRYLTARRKSGYGLSLVLFVLALLAKPTAVMVPVILFFLVNAQDNSPPVPVCLDANARQKMMTLLPFIMLSILRLLAVLAARQGGSPVVSDGVMTFGMLAANALVSFSIYLIQVLCPFQLSVYYPFPESIPLWQPVVSGTLILLLTVAAIRYRHRRPMVFLGWIWFLVFLIPSFGVVRSGPWPARADHYMYIPLMGLMSALVWIVPARRVVSPGGRSVMTVTALTLVAFFATTAYFHVADYRNSVTLFSRALSLNPQNFLAAIGLGNAWRKQSRMDLAERYFRKAVTIKPDSPGAHNNLGLVLAAKGDRAGAENHFKAALALSPGFTPAQNNLVNLYLKQKVLTRPPDNRGGAGQAVPETQ